MASVNAVYLASKAPKEHPEAREQVIEESGTA
jgi:hypothetical protein